MSKSVLLLSWTLIAYLAGLKLHRQIPHILTSPVFTSTLLVIGGLWLTHTDYSTYRAANAPLDQLLGPAQVAMAVPLYKGWTMLKRHLSFILAGVSVGTITGMVIAVFAGKLLHLNNETILSLVPKSATTPIAMVASHSAGGIPELAAIFAVVTGILGLVLGPVLLRWMGVQCHLAKGLAMGTAGQMIGAARASQWGDASAAMGIVGMSLAALLIGLVTPLLSHLFI
ncbi:LrgB family protein [Desmospora activa]|uniref:Putative effector of murein hydrolase n=1 Tax=Desmospora activa DSM 45169 TaxID=1121389 RepID=A0A2T4ZBT5_9BACL|nr:LrgB family protein [Desmospora activa]PTM59335.1 putative effector of murein hydrolase [Desmospora activa DSM 45169]